MTDITIANRYAEALFLLGKEQGSLEALQQELDVLHEVFTENPGLVVFFENPRVTARKKKAFVDQVFNGLQNHLKSTILLLVERHRIDALPQIADQFKDKVRDEQGIAKLEVSSVKPVSENRKEELVQAFKSKLGKKHIEIENKVDPSLIGGLQIRTGNTIYDGSVKGKLNRLNRTIRTRKF